MATALTGLQSLSGINAISQSDPFATPEERHGGPVGPRHYQWGEQAKPYSWESQMTPAGSHGPYGLENQLLGDDMWFIEPAGMPTDDPEFTYDSPTNTRSHGAVNNKIAVRVPSQAESIWAQVDQMGNHAYSDGTSTKMQTNRLGDAKQDQWQEIWYVDNGSSDVPTTTKQIAYQANGFGAADSVSNAYHKANLFGYGSKHMHRRYATGPIPGNFMWMRPKGRPLFKTIAGPARPPIGGNSPFAGQDVGDAFAYDTGAVLLAQPEEYIPPPAPNIATRPSVYDNPYGTDSTEWW